MKGERRVNRGEKGWEGRSRLFGGQGRVGSGKNGWTLHLMAEDKAAFLK
jgi:hypothetical protein